jgi:cyclase
VLAALRKLTPKPVRYVVNTHWHDDHVIGNHVYREAFPAADFIAHAETRDYLPGLGLERRKQAFSGAARFVETLKDSLAKNKSLTGQPLTDEERAVYSNDIRIGERFVSEGPSAPIVLPTVTVRDRLTLHRGERTIEIVQLGRGHTAGDLVVWPVPFVGGEQSHIAEWAATLEKLLALRPAAIVPGHGPVMRDDAYVRTLAAMFASVARQTEAAVARGETLDAARRSINLEEFRKTLAGDSQLRRLLFQAYVAQPAVAAAFREATEKRRPRP